MVLRVFVAGLLITFNSIFAQHDEQNAILSEIITARVDSLRELSTLQYTSSLATKGQEPIKQHFIYDRGQYKSSLQFKQSGIQQNKVVAYNGDLYQELDSAQSTLSVTRNRANIPYLAMELVTVSHLFAVPPSSGYGLSIDTVQSEEIWRKFRDTATVQDWKEVAGHNCIMVQVGWSTSNGSRVLYDIAFAKDLKWYPISFTAKGESGRIAGEYRINAMNVTDAQGAQHIIPVGFKIKSFNEQGKLLDETDLTADVESLKINAADIPREIFTLPRDQADVFVDVDLHVSTHFRATELDHVSDIAEIEQQAGTRKDKPTTQPKNELSDTKIMGHNPEVTKIACQSNLRWTAGAIVFALITILIVVATAAAYFKRRSHRKNGDML